jgi:two-component system NarL family sensor kinase
MSEVDLLWIVFIATFVIVLFAAFLIAVVVTNQKKVFRAQQEKLDESHRLAEVLRQVPNQIISAQEEERGRVAKELHDGINQMLASIKYRLHALKTQHQANENTQEAWIGMVSGELTTIMEEVRRISHGLLPKVFVDYGFSPAVRALCDGYAERTHTAITCELTDLPANLSRGSELSIYRILQEALHNIEKHAGATAVSIITERRDDFRIIRICDNGKGFETREYSDAPGNRRGIGLRTMKERALLINGTLEVISSPGNGTELVLAISPEPPSHQPQ